mgnify:CR=1 FL=1|tara:strand:- start:83 stop:1447 length:1365 start_codon:yes stop_codon:yes gene_type:complete
MAIQASKILLRPLATIRKHPVKWSECNLSSEDMKKFLGYIITLLASSLALPAAANINEPTFEATLHIEKIVLGSGCFWGAEKGYESLPGVLDAVSGYADGMGIRPTYREITKPRNRFNQDNHAEVVEVTFNESAISIEDLLKHYFESHDPTQVNRQGNDIGTQYRSIILYSSEQQRAAIYKIMAEYQELLSAAGYGMIATAVKPIDEFYAAEEYHQDYIKKNPRGYCPDHSTGVRFNKEGSLKRLNNSNIVSGKAVVILEPNGYCPYCEKFKKEVVADYKGSVPVVWRSATQLEGLQIKSPTWATPTFFFLDEGKEVFGRQGYMTAKEFYEALGALIMGGTPAHEVAFEEGTDPRFCIEYEIFKDTPDGIFIDKLSGAPLFDTKDRFDSSTGWLSFTKAVEGSVYTKPDNRYGMRRTEIRSVSSDIHLGHVFNDGPKGQPRYCINATVLDFKQR